MKLSQIVMACCLRYYNPTINPGGIMFDFRFISCLILVSCFMLHAQTVADSGLVFPKNLQVFPRNGDDSALVVASGKVTPAGSDSAILKVYRNNILFRQSSRPLSFTADTALFSMSVKIHAELASYRFELWVDAEKVRQADSVFCGDVILIDGQSNGAYFTGRAGPVTPWVHTFNGSAWTSIGGKLAKILAESTQVPLCVINCSQPGTMIGSHLGGWSLINMAKLAGVTGHVRAIIWHQGEDNSRGNADSYTGAMNAMVIGWKQNFPSLERVFMFQIRPGCYRDFAPNGPSSLFEAQRRVPQVNPLVRIMATAGLPGHDGDHCHYTIQGYDVMSEWLAPLILRDLYGSTDTAGIDAPDVQCAYYATPEQREIVVRFSQPVVWPADSLGVSMKDYFYPDTTTGLVDSGWIVSGSNEVHLRLKAPCTATRLTYLPDGYYNGTTDWYEGPWIRNGRGIGAMAFNNVPIGPAMPAVPVRLEATLPSDTLETDLTYAIAATAVYSDSSRQTVSVDILTSGAISPDGGNNLRAVLPGAAVVIARFTDRALGGWAAVSDTLNLMVKELEGPVVFDSLVIGMEGRSTFVGCGNSLNVTACYSRGSDYFTKNVETAAGWVSTDTAVVKVDKGRVFGVSEGASVAVIASFDGKADTALVTVLAAPPIVRINFQLRSTPLREGWAINDGAAYSDAAGQGWLGAIGGARDDRANGTTNFLLQSLNYTTVETGFKVKVPDGRYVLRLGLGDNTYGSSYTWIRKGGDTLSRYAAGPNTITTNTVTVSGGNGLVLTVYGAINYLVLMPDNGTDINLAADDGYVPSGTTVAERNRPSGPMKLTACPNPFNPVTTVRFTLPSGVSAVYKLFDVRGNLVLSQEIRPMAHEIQVRPGASGIYFGKLVCSDGRKASHSLVLLK